jgi:hypothetical protein
MFMVDLQNSMNLWKVEHGSCSEMYLTSDDGNEVSDIKVENDTDVREDDSMPAVFSAVKAECEVSCMCVTSHNRPELSCLSDLHPSVYIEQVNCCE